MIERMTRNLKDFTDDNEKRKKQKIVALKKRFEEMQTQTLERVNTLL